jgi:GNAT superfamily N-acetyltransferase
MPSKWKISDLEIPAALSNDGVAARFLCGADQPAIFTLLQGCEDFSLLSSGLPATEEDALELLHDRPPGIAPDQKAVIGFFDRDHRLIAALDFLAGYPEENIWFIGLLLIHPDQRGRGSGKSILSAFEAWARANQAEALMLGVLECNTAALRFWQSNGFWDVERTGPRVYGLREHTVIRMRKDL